MSNNRKPKSIKKGWKSTLTHAIRDMAESEDERREADRSRAAYKAGKAIVNSRGPTRLSSAQRPERKTSSGGQPPNWPAVRSDSLPVPSLKQLAISMAGGAAATGLGGAMALSNGALSSKRREPIGPSAPLSGNIPLNPGPSSTGLGGKRPNQEILNGGSILVPVAMSSKTVGHSPHIWARAKRGNVEVTVEHTEYVRDVVQSSAGAAGAFPSSLSSYDVNPGNGGVFSWLADLANLFDTYQFQKLEFEYNPSVGTDTDGKKLLTFDPDIMDDAPDSKQEMLEARIQDDTPPYAYGKLVIPRDVLGVERYNRRGAVPAGADPHEYDLGRLHVATPGCPAGTLGELFVTYRVVFRSPNGGKALAGAQTVVGMAVASPLGTSLTLSANSNMFLTWVSGTTFTLSNPGIYMLRFRGIGTGFAGHFTLAAVLPNSIIRTTGATASGTAATVAASEYVVDNADTTALWTLGSPAGAATLTSLLIEICDWEADIFL
jgi:hypothetical protein